MPRNPFDVFILIETLPNDEPVVIGYDSLRDAQVRGIRRVLELLDDAGMVDEHKGLVEAWTNAQTVEDCAVVWEDALELWNDNDECGCWLTIQRLGMGR